MQILSQLEQCKKFPDFNNYLAFIISQGDSLPVEVCCIDVEISMPSATKFFTVPYAFCSYGIGWYWCRAILFLRSKLIQTSPKQPTPLQSACNPVQSCAGAAERWPFAEKQFEGQLCNHNGRLPSVCQGARKGRAGYVIYQGHVL